MQPSDTCLASLTIPTLPRNKKVFETPDGVDRVKGMCHTDSRLARRSKETSYLDVDRGSSQFYTLRRQAARIFQWPGLEKMIVACSIGVSNGGANRLMSLSPTNPSSVCRAFLFVRLLPWKRNAPNDFPTVDRERRSFFRHSGRRVDVASFQGTCEIVPLAIVSGVFDPRDVPLTRLSIQQGTCLVPKSWNSLNSMEVIAIIAAGRRKSSPRVRLLARVTFFSRASSSRRSPIIA